jgi:polysaccharide deacetylase 2 family uncharacterized protein YibQ
MKVAEAFFQLDFPITLAVLPYRRYSREVAREAERKGMDVLLHIPLEPRDYPMVNPGTGCLLLSMGRECVQSEITAQLSSLPFCVGVNNHMGSSFMEQNEQVRWVLSVVRDHGLFFVDSLTTSNSVGSALAEEIGVPLVRRTHFLDTRKNEHDAIKQLCRLADDAARYGGAIGFAHPSEEMAEAIPKALIAFEQKGVRLVSVSEMVFQ